MQHSFLKLAGLATLAAGLAISQTAPHPGEHKGGGRGGMMMNRFGDLNLTDAQKEQAKSIFAASRQSSQAVHSQLRQSHEALAAAVKNGASDTQIDSLSNAMAPLIAQTTAIETKAFAKFYALLTPEQKDKVNAKADRFMNGKQ